MANLSTNDIHNRTVAAFFDTRGSADQAVSDLIAAGVSREHVTVTGSDTTTTATSTADHGGFWESLKDMFLPDDDRHVYAEGLRRGGFVVSVRAEDANYDRVLDILDQDGAVDLDQREATWRADGWTGYTGDSALTGDTGLTSTAAALASTTATSRTTTDTQLGLAAAAPAATVGATSVAKGGDEVISLYEEQLRVGKRDVNHGRVRIRSYVVETPVSEQISLRNESVQVERRPVNRAVSATDALFQDRVIEAEEHVEEAIVAKDVFVKEEISLRKTAEDQVRTISDTVRRTEVEVQDERGAVATGAPRALGTLDTTQIGEHMDVIASDGTKIGTVDHLDGPDRIKLAKTTSPDGQHHYIPLTWVDHVDTHVHLTKTTAEAKAGW